MRALVLTLSLLAACAAPDLPVERDPAIARAAYPNLVPLDAEILDGPPPRQRDASAPDLRARAEALRDRAAALRGNALDPAERERIGAAMEDLRAQQTP